MCGRTQLTMPRADPEEGAGVRTPAPWKITNSIGLYRNMQLDPLLHGKIGPHWKCWTVRLLWNTVSESYSLMIVFFEKAMITGLPLQNKLRTYKKRRKKSTSELCFIQSDLDPPPHIPKPDENFLDPRMDIRYRDCKESMPQLKTFYSAAKI